MGKPPRQSRIVRAQTVAYAEAKDDKKKAKPDDKVEDKAEDKAEAEVEAGAKVDAKLEAKAEAKADTKPEPKAEPAVETKPEEADTKPIVTVSSPRAHTETMAMPADHHGKPPELPTTAPPSAPVSTADVESPTNMPTPKNVPGGDPDDAAPPPGRVPPGDSRSLRKGGEFALVYRQGTFVISRAGTIGKRGVWRVVEYPTASAGSHGYAKECSRFISEGFSDYRD
jgi:hypothetical protein